MSTKNYTELMELDFERRWEYLKRYYKVSEEFYNIKDVAVSDDEVEKCIRNFKEKPSPIIRKVIKLKDWNFKLDEEEQGLREEYYSREHDESKWEKVAVPHAIMHVPDDPVGFGKTDYPTYITEKGEYCKIWRGDYSTWYKKRIDKSALGDDKVAYLHFESVNLKSDVWVNEFPVMIDHLGLFPFGMNVTDSIRTQEGKETVIAVRVSNTASTVPELFYNGVQYAYSTLPYTEGRTKLDWPDQVWTGIAGDVTLSIRNKNHIEDVFIYTDSIMGNDAFVKCSVKLRNESWKRFTGKVRLKISKWFPDEGEVIKTVDKEVTVLPLNDSEECIDFEIKNADLWDVDTPNLYLVHAVLMDDDGNELDDVFETFGVRTIKVKGSHFYLNNKRIVPRGTHDVCHYYGEPAICPGDRIIVKDILLHKKMNANCSRWPSDIRMHYKRIADYCDQLGFMLSWTGYFEMWTIHPEAELYSLRDVRAMVRSLRNCPSIIVWEMGDEPLMFYDPYRRFRWHEKIYELVEAEDKSRPIIPSGYYCNDLVDLVHNYDGKEKDYENRRKDILKDFPVFDKELEVWDFHHCPCLPPFTPTRIIMDRVRDTLGGQKPVIFTEFGTDGLPKPENVRDVYGGFRWAENLFIISPRKKMDLGIYGREITEKDWRETQALQAAVIGGMIGYFRQYPEAFAGFYFVTMFDLWTFYWGAVDALGNCKLMFYVAQNYFKDIYVSGLHGNTVLTGESIINITASNLGDKVEDSTLCLAVKDSNNQVVYQMEVPCVSIEGGVSLSQIAEIKLPGLTPGLYSIEYYLKNKAGSLISKNVELFFMD